jgi:hypothetical protein
MNAFVPEIYENIRKADTIFAFSVHSCNKRTERYFSKILPQGFHFCVRFVCRFYFVVWKGNRQHTCICHVTITLGSYIRATELIRWPHIHNSCWPHICIYCICIWCRTNPLASYTFATGNPLASYTYATGNTLASYTSATGQSVGLAHSCHMTNPAALYTQFSTGQTCWRCKYQGINL